MGFDDRQRVHDDPVRDVSRSGEAVIVALVGELDLYNVEPLRRALAAAVADRPGRVVVDLREVSFVDSTVLGVLVEMARQLDDPSALALAGAGPETRRALDVSGLAQRFSLYDSVDEALA